MGEVKMPTAFILAGGRGMRLRPLTDDCPKPLLPMAGKPTVQRILEDLYLQGVRRAVLLTGYRGEQIKQVLEDRFCDMELFFIKEERPMGSAGCLYEARALGGDRFFVVCGDACGERDYGGMLDFHLTKGGIGSIFLSRVSNPVEYGLVDLRQDGSVSSFLEKPVWAQAYTDLANTGIYLLEKEVFDFIPKNRPSDFGKDVFPAILSSGKRLFGYEDGRFWRDMGDHASFLGCNLRQNGGQSVIGKNCRVKGALPERSVLFDGVTMEKNCRVTGSIVGRDCHLGEGCVLEEGCVLGTGCRIGAGVVLEKNTVLDSYTTVEKGGYLPKRPFGLADFWQDSDLLFEKMPSEDFYIRLGYAFARAAGGRVGIMRDEDDGSARICTELLKGTFLAGQGATTLGQGFYTKASAAAYYGNFPLTVFVCKEKTDGHRLVLFDSAGLPASGALVRKIKDAYLSPVVCGRVGRADDKAQFAMELYKNLLLAGAPSLVGLTVGMERSSSASDFLAKTLESAGASVVPLGQGRLDVFLTADGRRCRFLDEQGRAADFWHLAAVALSDCIRKGGRIGALPEWAPEALFCLVSQNRCRPISFALSAAAPCSPSVREALASERFLVDGCILAARCLSIMVREGVDLGHLLALLPRFATVESGIDCREGEKMALLLSLHGTPCAEGVCLRGEKGRLLARARGGRGLLIMAEAAAEEDAEWLLQQAKKTIAEEKSKDREAIFKRLE